ncbi:MAG TPA: T9SS type A sorting domain-containing protein, partial [Candidatus Krumholzibacterium sp.]|nr:T9SS type A sorting domain-containing protein [Candidatus Krumholzibacterium sp.]
LGPGALTGDDDPAMPLATSLAQNYPNPFNPATTIRFDLKEDSKVMLSVYNVNGGLVATLVDRNMTAGRKEIRWEGRDGMGSPVSSGVYFYRMVAGDFVQTRKMVLMR